MKKHNPASLLKADLIRGPIFKSLLIFAIPILLANIFQQLYNTVDTMIVGNCLGDVSLAAIGATGAVYELLVGFALGVGNGMSIVTARSYGSGDDDELKKSVAGSIVIGILLTGAIMLFSVFGLYPLLQLLNTPAEIIEESYSYISFLTLFAGVMFAYNLCAGLLRAVGDSFTPLLFLILSSLLNIVLDLLFISVFDTGIVGAAVATVISQAVSAVLCIIYIIRRVPVLIPKAHHFRPDAELYKELAGQGFSMGFMVSIVSLGTVILQYAINGLGTLIIAGHIAARKLSYFCMMPLMTTGIALSTFVSQNKGADQPRRIRDGIKYANLISLGLSIFDIILLWLFAPALIHLISGSSSDVVIGNGSMYMRFDVLFYPVLGVLFNSRYTLQGIGRKVIPLVSSIMECIGKAIFVVLLIPSLEYFGVILCEPVIWLFMTAQLWLSVKRDPYLKSQPKNKP